MSTRWRRRGLRPGAEFSQMNQVGLAMGGRLDNAILVDDKDREHKCDSRKNSRCTSARSDRRSLSAWRPSRATSRRPRPGIRTTRDGEGDSRLARKLKIERRLKISHQTRPRADRSIERRPRTVGAAGGAGAQDHVFPVYVLRWFARGASSSQSCASSSQS